MLKATYDLDTKVLTIFGNNIKTFVETIDEMGEWRTVNDLDGNPLFDVQLDFDDSIDENKHTKLNVENYNLQYVNLIRLSDNEDGQMYEMGHNWQNAELTIIKTKKGLKVLGATDEIKFVPNHNTIFEVRSKKGDVLFESKSLNKTSDYKVLHGTEGCFVVAIDELGLEKKIG
jgi:hypothetical protein